MIDFLVVAAHPDDAEIACGGTLARMSREGRGAAILDLTEGELSSRGNPATRAREAEAAARTLGLRARSNAGIPDGGIDPMASDQRLRVVAVLRELRPRVVALPWPEVRHPDHRHAALLGEEAVFRSGLHRVETETEPFRPAIVLYYMERYPFEPSLVVDISHDHGTKMAAVRAFRSQFETSPGDDEPETFLTRPGFLASVEARDRYYGDLAGFTLGEPYRIRGPLPVGSLATLFPED